MLQGSQWILTSVPMSFNMTRKCFQEMMLGQLDIHMEKDGVVPLCHTMFLFKINLLKHKFTQNILMT